MIFFLIAAVAYGSLGLWAASWTVLPPEPEVWLAYAIGWLPLLSLGYLLIEPEMEWTEEWKHHKFVVTFKPHGGRVGRILIWLTFGFWSGLATVQDSHQSEDQTFRANFWRCKFIASQLEQELDDVVELVIHPFSSHLRRCA